MIKKTGGWLVESWWRVDGECDGVYRLLELILETISKSYCAKSVRKMNMLEDKGMEWPPTNQIKIWLGKGC